MDAVQGDGTHTSDADDAAEGNGGCKEVITPGEAGRSLDADLGQWKGLTGKVDQAIPQSRGSFRRTSCPKVCPSSLAKRREV